MFSKFNQHTTHFPESTGGCYQTTEDHEKSSTHTKTILKIITQENRKHNAFKIFREVFMLLIEIGVLGRYVLISAKIELHTSSKRAVWSKGEVFTSIQLHRFNLLYF